MDDSATDVCEYCGVEGHSRQTCDAFQADSLATIQANSPPKTLTLSQTVEGESARLPLRFNEDSFLISAILLWWALAFFFNLMTEVTFNSLLGGGLVTGFFSAVFFSLSSWFLLEGIGLNLYGTSKTEEGQVPSGLVGLLISIAISQVYMGDFTAAWIPWLDSDYWLPMGLSLALALAGTGLSLLFSMRRGRLNVTADRMRLHGRNGQTWPLASVIEVKTEKEEVLINGKIVKGLEGLTPPERDWVVVWLQELIRIRVDEVGAPPPGLVAETAPEALSHLVGKVETERSQ